MKLIAAMMLLAMGSAARAEPVVAPPLEVIDVTPVVAVDNFRRALATGAEATAAALLADDATIFEEGHFESRTQYVAGHLEADLAFAEATTYELLRREAVEVGELAYVVSEGRTRGTYSGRAIDSISTESMVLRRDGVGWKIVHIHWSSRPAD